MKNAEILRRRPHAARRGAAAWAAAFVCLAAWPAASAQDLAHAGADHQRELPGGEPGMGQGMEEGADRHTEPRSEPAGVPNGHIAAASGALDQDIRLVEDLLRLDAQAALAAGRRRAGLHYAPGAEAAPAQFGQQAVHAPAVRLAAIYGVAGRLHADVMVDGRLQTYRAGRKLPLGIPAGFGAPELERIAGACIELAGGGAPQRLCLSTPQQTEP